MKMERKKMAAKFAGECRECGGRIAVGAAILWAKGEGAIHAACEKAPLVLVLPELVPETEEEELDVEVMMLRREREEESALAALEEGERRSAEAFKAANRGRKHGPWESTGWVSMPRGWKPEMEWLPKSKRWGYKRV